MVSVAWMIPTRPGRIPSTPPSAHDGTSAGRRRFGIKAAIAGAALGREDAGLALEAEDRAVDVGLAGEHTSVIDQIARGKVVGAVDDEVEVAEDVSALSLVRRVSNLRTSTLGLIAAMRSRGGVELLAADIVGAVDNLALQIGEIDNIEIDDARVCPRRPRPDRAPAASPGRRRRCTAPRLLQLELPLHANFGHDGCRE